MRYKSPFFQPFTAGLYSELDRWQGTSCMYFAIPSFSNSFAAFRAESWVPIGAPMLLYHFVREKSWVKVMIFGKITTVTSLYKNHQGIKVVFLKKNIPGIVKFRFQLQPGFGNLCLSNNTVSKRQSFSSKQIWIFAVNSNALSSMSCIL